VPCILNFGTILKCHQLHTSTNLLWRKGPDYLLKRRLGGAYLTWMQNLILSNITVNSFELWINTVTIHFQNKIIYTSTLTPVRIYSAHSTKYLKCVVSFC